MKRLLYLSALWAVFASSYTVSVAQTAGFTHESEAFLKDMTAFMEAGNKDKSKDLMKSFSDAWKSGAISEDQKMRIYDVADSLKLMRARAFPNFENYLNVLILFAKSSPDPQNYDTWENIVRIMIRDSRFKLNDVDAFLVFTQKLLQDGTVSETSSATWLVQVPDYRFVWRADSADVRVEFSSTNLICYSRKDSIYIENTQGIFHPFTLKWSGSGGKVYWERSGFTKDSVYAQLNNYQIQMKKVEYHADTVQFVNKRYFPSPLTGALDDKITYGLTGERVVYPKFIAYEKVRFNDIVPNVDYSGGFAMEGGKFQSNSAGGERATLIFKDKGKPVLRASASYFAFRPNEISSGSASIALQLRYDSVYHSDVAFKYFPETQEMAFIRTDDNKRDNMFINSYHNLNIDAEFVKWRLGDSVLIFRGLPGSGDNEARMRSSNYFSMKEYKAMQGIDPQHPIVILKNYSNTYNTRVFYASELARELKQPTYQVKQVLLQMASKGFIIYDSDTERVELLEYLFDYLDIRAGTYDHDIIAFNSINSGAVSNALLNLKTYELTVEGVDYLPVYEKQVQKPVVYNQGIVMVDTIESIGVTPKNGTVLMKRNLNFAYDGNLKVGSLTFMGSDFSFEYDRFKFNLDKVDYLQVAVSDVDSLGRMIPGKANVLHKIEDIKGDLHIDAPTNKSAKQDYADFPIFNSKTDSYVYYDEKEINEVTYPRDEFYFKIYPYIEDSLFRFTTKNWRLKGYFEAGGIIPSFEEYLTIQKDTSDYRRKKPEEVYSFGFVKTIDDEGMELYNGKGTLHDAIRLSMKGLIGAGRLSYQTSQMYSKKYTFQPDYMVAEVQNFKVKKQTAPVEFPAVSGQYAHVDWFPTEDKMDVITNKYPLNMFEDLPVKGDTTVVFNGTLTVTPEGLLGKGGLSLASMASLSSQSFKFGAVSIDGEPSVFDLKAVSGNATTFRAEKIASHIDLKRRYGFFKSLSDSSFARFPDNQYICYMDQFEWFMDEQKINLSTSDEAIAEYTSRTGQAAVDEDGNPLVGAKFISLHPTQDSLSFMSNKSSYDIVSSTLTIEDITLIRIADAIIYPSTSIIIEKNAEIRPLTNAVIIADNKTKYHEIFNAEVQIYGKYDYGASGDYYYTDKDGEQFLVHFDEITVDTLDQTFALGDVSLADSFMLSPNFAFKQGDISLFASDPELHFSGYAQISHLCDSLGMFPFQFESPINPDSVVVPLPDRLWDINRNEVFNGIYIGNQHSAIYTAFASKVKSRYDKNIVPLEGVMYYDESSGYYKIAKPDVLHHPMDTVGNFMQLQRSACVALGMGTLNLGLSVGQVKLTTSGEIVNDIIAEDVNLSITLGLDFFMNGSALDKMADDMVANPNLTAIEYTNQLRMPKIKKQMIELAGKAKTDRFFDEIATKGELNLPRELQHTLTFVDMKMAWNPVTRSYRSEDEMLKIAFINGKPVNRTVRGYVELVKKYKVSEIRIYIEVAPGKWYYFDYSRGLMQVVSSNNDFNSIITSLKPKDTQLEVERGQEPYEFRIGPEQLKNAFIRRFDPSFVPVEEDDDIDDIDNGNGGN